MRSPARSLLIVAVGFVLLTGCAAPTVSETPTPTAAAVESVGDASTSAEVVAWILSQDELSSNDVLNGANRLRALATDEYSAAALGDIPVRLLDIAMEAVDRGVDDPVGDLQVELEEYAKQVRELG